MVAKISRDLSWTTCIDEPVFENGSIIWNARIRPPTVLRWCAASLSHFRWKPKYKATHSHAKLQAAFFTFISPRCSFPRSPGVRGHTITSNTAGYLKSCLSSIFLPAIWILHFCDPSSLRLVQFKSIFVWHNAIAKHIAGISNCRHSRLAPYFLKATDLHR